MAVRPIVVTGCARSGTSMIAGLLHLHGMWVGRCRQADERNPKGFFENKRINKLLRNDGDLTSRNFEYAVKRILRREGYRGGYWVVKHGVTPHWHVWDRLNPHWVLVRREPGQIFLSQIFNCKRVENIKRQTRIMDEIKARRNGHDIHPEKIVHGDYEEIEHFMGPLGLAFSPTIAEEFVEKELWN